MLGKSLLEHVFGEDQADGPQAAVSDNDTALETPQQQSFGDISDPVLAAAIEAEDNTPFRKSSALTSRGDDENDVLNGAGDNDRLFGEGGDDTLKGKAGDDVLFGGDGDDKVVGGGGDDNIKGGGGNDKLVGGGGEDTLKGQAGDDNIRGGGGNDIIKGQAGNDIIKGNGGSDFIVGGGGDDTIIAGSGNDTLKGGGGSDTFQFAKADFSRAEETQIRAFQNGSDKVDLIRLNIASFSDLNLTQDGNNTVLSIDNGELVFLGRSVDQFSADDFLLAPPPLDPFLGDNNANTIDGDAGNNLIQGLGGDDVLGAGQGRDTLVGGDGADKFVVRLVNGEIDPQVDIISDFSYISNDRIGLTEVLNGISFSALENVVDARIEGENTVISVKRGETAEAQDVFILEGVQFVTEDLINYGFTAPPTNSTDFVDNPYGFQNRTLVTSDPDATTDGTYVVWVDKQNLDNDPLDFDLSRILDGLGAPGVNSTNDIENKLPSRDVFIMNTSTGIIQRVSQRDPEFDQSEALSPAISADGRIVAYVQETGNNTGEGNVFIRDMSFPDSDPILISVDASGQAAGGTPISDLQRGNLSGSQSNISVSTVDISADGSKVAFVTTADLTGDDQTDTNGSLDVYLRDIVTGQTKLISAVNDVAQGTVAPYTRLDQSVGDVVKMSADGRYILFSSAAPVTAGETDQNVQSGDRFTDIYLADAETGQIIRITTDATGEAGSFDISADGTRVVFATTENIGDDGNGLSDVYIADIDLTAFAVETPVRASEAEGRFEVVGGSSYAPIISDDGQRIAFLSDATDLSPFGTNGVGRINDDDDNAEQLFILDLQTKVFSVPPADIALTDSDSMINHAVLVDDGIIFRKEVAATDSRRNIADTLTRAEDVDILVLDVPEGESSSTSTASSQRLEDTTVIRSSIDSATDNDVFTFKNTGSQTKTFSVSVEGVSSGGGSLANPKVSVTTNNPINTFNFVSDEDSGTGDDAFLTFSGIALGGSHFIRVESQDGSTGSYRLRIETSPLEVPEPTPIFGPTIFDL